MQSDKAMKLRERWGSRPCLHPSIDREYIQGSQTGDYVCTQCGRVVDPDRGGSDSERDGSDGEKDA